ncbi:TonB-dependent receptor [Runella slithyformis]|uniref:TonB-dependent receptor plug n=1 Tax=Runella slithyformis (strain ATCC 29530 / DSM 19594 / LMG 11500 / NCIMB 11436 / LSU 4) TaxID=761193 RepID=A0A7U3ZHG1_RUNSL|nr:TonB-dependent receptor [Runella slithyformis]AEI47311.1 TonB-dependent receptor plug [Runella slithyformis DSM 19594]
MKKKVRFKPLVYHLMKISLIQCVLAVVFAGVSLAHEALAQEILSRRVTINVENQDVRKALSAIEKQVKIRFAYRPVTVPADRKITFSASNEPLAEVLGKLMRPLHLKYEIIGNQIILTPEKEVKPEASSAPLPAPNVPAFQMARKVSGIVTDESNAGLPGVSVVLKGTQRGTNTNSEGKFDIEVPDDKAVLVFSFLGYFTQEIAVGSQTQLNVSLKVDTKSLEEVIVVGYGVQRKSDLTGAVATVKGETLQERPSASLNQALGGRLTGVNVSVNSGRPGGRANIRIRGNTSVSVANNPLYVIDGVILNATDLANGSTPIDYINPNDIASIEVLKDASATAIYGARGANGVILVTTKRGSQDGGRINYDSDFSVGVLPRKIPLLNSEEFLRTEEIAYQNAKKYDPVGWAGGKYVNPVTKRTNPLLFDASGKPLYNTDWQDESFQRAFTQNHQLSFSGGNSKDNFGLYLGYRNEDGLMKESWLKRYSARFVMDSQIKKWIKVGGSLSYNDQSESQVDPLGNGGIIAMRQVLEALPIIPVKYPDGRWGGNEDYPGMEGGGNPIHVATERLYYLKTQTMLGNIYSNISLAKGLELRTTLGTNIINQRIDYYGGRTLNYISRNQGGDASITGDRHNSWQFENYLTYNTKINSIHSVNALLGLAWQHVDRFNFVARAQRFQDDYFQFNNLGAGAVALAPTSGTSAYGLNSYFGRINYGLKDKYLLTVTGRIDGSSKFGSANRYAVFPSAALAWRVIEEEFMQNVPFISNLKVRTSYGVTGNSEITAYQALAGLGNYSVIFNNARQIGIGVNRLANPDLRWEKTAQVDAGLEVGLFNNRVMLEADIYRKLTTDMLLSAPVPSSSGFTTVSQNIGSMENRGVELGLNTVNVATSNFSWNSTFNISFNRNRVIALTGGADIFSGSTIIREGEPVGSFFGFVHQGTWSQAEESEAAKYLKKPGDIKYQDVNNDGRINDNDRVVIGKGIPDGFGTFINTLSHKNLELMVDLQFMYGNDVLFRSKHSAEDRQGIANSFKTVLNAWTPTNQNTNIAELRPVSAGYNTNNDTDRVQDGSFLRGRNILLSYKFSPKMIEKIHLNRLRAFISVQNFFLRTKFQGYDPEVSTSGSAFDQGVDLYAYPKPRVFMVGLNIGL